MDLLVLKIKFNYDENYSTLVKDLHEIYRKHGFSFPKPDCGLDNTEVTYEEACKVNQFCFDNRVEFEEWEHFRISWKCDWVLFVDSSPIIEAEEMNDGMGRYYKKQKEEWLFFPENRIEEEELNEIFKLMGDLYKNEFISGLELQKEYSY